MTMSPKSLHIVLLAATILWGCAGGKETQESQHSPSQGPSVGLRASSGAARIALEGPQWRLIELNGDLLADQVGGRWPYIHLDGGTKRLDGFGGCNRIGGAYTAKGDSLLLGPLISTQMACPGPQMEVEQAFTQALGACRNWKIDGKVLSLSAGTRLLAKLIPQDGEEGSE